MADSNETRTLKILASVPTRSRTGVDFETLEAELRIAIRAELDAAYPRASGKPGILVVEERGATILQGIDLGLPPGTYDVPVGALVALPTVTRR